MLPAVKTLGLIGGTTWHSTVEYYRALNERINARLGGLSSARLILYSVNFQELQPPADPAGWARVAEVLGDIARRLEQAGAECLVICANTPHGVADQVQARIGIPLLHIADPTAEAIVQARLERVALLGTRPTMEQAFFTSRLAARGVAALVPDEADRVFLHSTILAELGRGVFRPETREAYVRIIEGLVARGAQGVILGCTEIPLLVRPGDCSVPTFDTTALHVGAAVDFALG
jgi:aspartate racemase